MVEKTSYFIGTSLSRLINRHQWLSQPPNHGDLLHPAQTQAELMNPNRKEGAPGDPPTAPSVRLGQECITIVDPAVTATSLSMDG